MQLSHEHVETMIRHCRAELPNEACGVLAGAGDTVSAVHCLENARHSTVAYELSAAGYLLVADLDDAGQLLGVFHSHPRGEAYPSPTDRRQAAWDIPYVIISLQDRTDPVMRSFHIAKASPGDMTDLGTITEENLEISDNGTVDA